jgi:hypothetical protein
MKTKAHSATPTLGVDIGRVIIHGDGPDTSFVGGSDEEALRAPAMDGAFEAIARLTQRFSGRVHLVSKCGSRVQAKTRAWLARHRFFEATGISPAHLHFCRDRKEKAPICAALGVGFFVDDRVDVLSCMAGVVRHRFLFGASSAPVGVVPVPTWAAAEQAILAALSLPPETRGTPVERAP